MAAHMGRKISTAFAEDTLLGHLTFPERGTCLMKCDDSTLTFELESTSEHLENLEKIIGGHLARFGAGPNGLVVRWVRADKQPGTVQGPYTKEEVAQRRREYQLRQQQQNAN
ncbi:DUF2218 domain-containing protein [Actinomycetaceae bacterium TAE3-ERU4]|nr:DUF2218 domain-containing protein [Actinomycetaceae bacterium TAE3-ERU4]